MFQGGKVSVDEAERLLDALRDAPSEQSPPAQSTDTYEKLSVVGGAHFDRDLAVTALSVAGNVQVAGDTNVKGRVNVGKAMDVGKDLSVKGGMQVGQSAHFAGGAQISGRCNAGQNLQVSGDATISGSANAGKSLEVGGQATFSGKVRVGGEVSVGGDLRLDGEKTEFSTKRNVTVKRDLYLGHGTLEVKGDLIVDGKVIPRDQRP